VQPGESVVIYGAGPVGLMAAYSAVIKGANQVMLVERHPDRLALAEEIGAVVTALTRAASVSAGKRMIPKATRFRMRR
jgi:glutathione-independent formaldehyde dehydrogenase